MPNKKRRVVLDTNLFISFLITSNYTALHKIFSSDHWLLIFGNELINEFIEVARRPKFRRFFSVNDIKDLLILLHEHADFVTVTTKVEICRDAKDDFLLALAVDGKADLLITVDQDLLVLEQYDKTRIITISEFLKLN